jgi:hypothetical protein
VGCGRFGQVMLALTLTLPAIGALSEEKPPYEWTCRSQGYFEMKVSPDGKITPVADTSLTDPISILIRRRVDDVPSDTLPRDMTFPFDDEYVVGFTGKQAEPFSEEPSDLETSGARFYSGKQGLYEVSAMYYEHYRPYVLTLKTADKDWVFSIQSGSLTTDSEARHMNITLPSKLYGPSVPEASVFFMTGPCVRDR